MRRADGFTFWETIDSFLDERRDNLTQMCEAIGIPYGTVNVQRTRHTIPKLDQLLLMAKYFGKSIEELVYQKEIPDNPHLQRIERIRRACMIATEEDLALVERILRIGNNARVPFDFSPNPYKLDNR